MPQKKERREQKGVSCAMGPKQRSEKREHVSRRGQGVKGKKEVSFNGGGGGKSRKKQKRTGRKPDAN